MKKKNALEIQEMAKSIDVSKAAKEMLTWLTDNVDNYIDNKETVFSLYFPVDKKNLDTMDQIFNLGSLYQKIEKDEDNWDAVLKKSKAFNKEKAEQERECIKKLDAVVELIKNEMAGNKDLLEKLFKKLIYYYEMTGFSIKSGPVIQDMEGYVTVNKFFYEPIGMDLTVTKRYQRKNADGTLEMTDKKPEIVKKEHIPEGFVVEIELKKWQKQKIVSMF